MAGKLEPHVLMRRVAAVAALAAIAALSVAAVSHLRERPAQPPIPVRLSFAAPAGTVPGSADGSLDAAISPDQREVVFVATQLRRAAGGQPPQGASQLWRRRLDAEEAVPIAGTDGARFPAWKRTGNVVSFFADLRLKLVNLQSGEVTDIGDAADPAGAAWLSDGSLLFVPAAGPIRRMVGGRTTDATQLTPGDTAHVFPAASDDGRSFTYTAIRSDGRRVVRLNAGGQEAELGTTASHALLPDDRWLLFIKDGVLLGDYRNEDGKMAGRDIPLVLGVGHGQGRGLFVASRDLLLYAKSIDQPHRVAVFDMSGATVGFVVDAGDYWQVRVSPDDRNVTVTARDPLLGSLDVLMAPMADTGPALRLTTSLSADTDPVWSPDGRRVAFQSRQRGRDEVFTTPAAITPGAENPSTFASATMPGDGPTDWRGNELLIQRRGRAGFDLVRVNETTGAATIVANSPFNETDGRWSPDGRLIAYVSDEPGRPDVYVQDSRGDRQRVSIGGGIRPRWTRNGRALLFLRDSRVMRSELTAQGRFTPPKPLFELAGARDFDVARRTDRIIAVVPVEITSTTPVSVLLNWRSLAEQQKRAMEKPSVPKF